jgi:hypothetical protein
VIVTNREPAPRGVALGDFNGDGRQDVASAVGTMALVLRGDGHGGLLKPVAFPVGAHSVRLAAADLNGDGMLDVVTGNGTDATVSVLLNGPRAAPVLRDLTLMEEQRLAVRKDRTLNPPLRRLPHLMTRWCRRCTRCGRSDRPFRPRRSCQ